MIYQYSIRFPMEMQMDFWYARTRRGTVVTFHTVASIYCGLRAKNVYKP